MSTVATELQTWLAHITQTFGHNGETGVDIGLPYHTPVYALTSGPVLGVNPQYGGGGVVSIRSAIDYAGINGPASIYYQHLSDIVVKAGQQVQAGQLIGYSGGQLGYGDNPSSSRFSSGPHIEVGINAPYGGAWSPLGPNVNPLGWLKALVSGGSAPLTSGGSPGSPGAQLQSASSLPGGLDLNPADWVTAIKTGFTDATQRFGLVFFGGMLVLIGVLIVFFAHPSTQEPDTQQSGQQGGAPELVAIAGEAAA